MTRKHQIPRAKALRVAVQAMETLKAQRDPRDVSFIYLCGSLRRGCDPVGDVDLLTTCRDDLRNARNLGQIIVAGEFKVYVIVDFEGEEIQVDVNYCEPHQLGSALLHHTGPVEFNIKCRTVAKAEGWALNQNGLFDVRKNVVASRTETDVLKALGHGLDRYVTPESRNRFSRKT